MHDSVRAFVRRVVFDYQLGGDVLEVGSYDVNGGVRDLFAGSHYWGIDIRHGPGVDEVCGFDWFHRFAGRYDVVVSTEMLEHTPTPWVSICDWAKVLRPGGHVVVTARGFGPDQGSTELTRIYGPHDYPHDYWRVSVEAMRFMFGTAGLEVLEAGPDTDPTAPGVFVVGRK